MVGKDTLISDLSLLRKNKMSLIYMYFVPPSTSVPQLYRKIGQKWCMSFDKDCAYMYIPNLQSISFSTFMASVAVMSIFKPVKCSSDCLNLQRTQRYNLANDILAHRSRQFCPRKGHLYSSRQSRDIPSINVGQIQLSIRSSHLICVVPMLKLVIGIR